MVLLGWSCSRNRSLYVVRLRLRNAFRCLGQLTTPADTVAAWLSLLYPIFVWQGSQAKQRSVICFLEAIKADR